MLNLRIFAPISVSWLLSPPKTPVIYLHFQTVYYSELLMRLQKGKLDKTNCIGSTIKPSELFLGTSSLAMSAVQKYCFLSFSVSLSYQVYQLYLFLECPSYSIVYTLVYNVCIWCEFHFDSGWNKLHYRRRQLMKTFPVLCNTEHNQRLLSQ